MAVSDKSDVAGATALRDGARHRRVAGLGSARNGLGEWRLQRLSALALIPLGLYFVVSVLHLVTAPGDDAASWLARPVNAFLMLMFVIAVVAHAAVGLRSVLADYVHGRTSLFLAEIAVRGAAFALSLAGLLAILKAFVSGGGS